MAPDPRVSDDTAKVPVRVPAGGWAWTTVDLGDLELAMERPLTLHSQGYVRVGRKYLHRLILCPAPGLVTDHINRNKLDNRRCNLRAGTRSDNQANQGKMGARSSSRFRGVHRHSTSPVWVAQISRDGRCHHLGCFDTEEAAAAAYNVAASEMHRQFAALNDGAAPGSRRTMVRCGACHRFASVGSNCSLCGED